jgi:hypothetical protein
MDWPKHALDPLAPNPSARVDFPSKPTPRGHGHGAHWGFLGPQNDRQRGGSACVDLSGHTADTAPVTVITARLV